MMIISDKRKTDSSHCFETSLIKSYPRYHSNCTIVIIVPLSDAVTPYAFTQQSRKNLLKYTLFGISGSEVMGSAHITCRDFTVPDSL